MEVVLTRWSSPSRSCSMAGRRTSSASHTGRRGKRERSGGQAMAFSCLPTGVYPKPLARHACMHSHVLGALHLVGDVLGVHAARHAHQAPAPARGVAARARAVPGSATQERQRAGKDLSGLGPHAIALAAGRGEGATEPCLALLGVASWRNSLGLAGLKLGLDDHTVARGEREHVAALTDIRSGHGWSGT